MTLILEDKGLLETWSHLQRILEDDNKSVQNEKVSSVFGEDVHAYLIWFIFWESKISASWSLWLLYASSPHLWRP